MTGLARLWRRGEEMTLTPGQLARVIARYSREHPDLGIALDGLAGYIASQLATGGLVAEAVADDDIDASRRALVPEERN